MPTQAIYTISDMRNLAEDVISMTFIAPEIARSAAAGQFIHIKCGHSRPLRRPISISDVSGDKLTVIFEVRGAGTRWLASRDIGRKVDILGPLGHGFGDTFSGGIIVVGGGIGAAPMLFAAKAAKRKAHSVTAVLGFRSQANVILTDEFDAVCDGLVTTTDDGTAGLRGNVSAPLEELLNTKKYGAVLACGPKPMLRAVAEMCAIHKIHCEISLEERMGCGVGACLVCACLMHNGERMSRVCKDGPVFDAKEVVWNG
ncbi:MAG: dihydroorotate dehydrogenase electron transfer subunit [Oscillospiraceae bacterium]|jgi:dihydroorotate dehydrogenase electron transfer subunit|nr:dihydroorotate dehydrogenase electron transfer subunit [Oscillospiraceae bacterium]